jgi:hypothetical protein
MGIGRVGAAMLLIGAFAYVPLALADEARTTEGQYVQGSLRLLERKLFFVRRTDSVSLALSQIERVRIEASLPPPFITRTALRLLLCDGQQLTGNLVQLDNDAARMRTAWGGQVEVPRAALAAITALPGWRLQFADDFAAGLGAWNANGKLIVERTPPAVVLDAGGQELTHTLSEPLKAGRVSINFVNRNNTSSGGWEFEAIFARNGARPWVVRVAAGDERDACRVGVPDFRGEQHKVARTPGMHRLGVEFSKGSLRVMLDDTVLWYTLKQGPPGKLRQVRLALQSGCTAWSDFAVEEAVDELPRPPGDSTQDEVWLCEGDQLFGEVRQANWRAIELKGRFGRKTLNWNQVQGCFFRHAALPTRVTAGAQVRLGLTSGLASELDILEGILQGWEAEVVTLMHSRLGQLRLPRSCVREVWPLFDGRRVELDNGFYPVGNATFWQSDFSLDSVPHQARLVLYGVPVPGAANPIQSSLAALSRADVIVNGRLVSQLVPEVRPVANRPPRFVIALPHEALRLGQNRIQLRHATESKSGRYSHCGVYAMALEVPEPSKGGPP